jgi:hypothetical protein
VEIQTIFKQGDKVCNFSKEALDSPVTSDTALIVGAFVDQQRFSLPNGEYEMEITVKDLNNPKQMPFVSTQTIEVGYPADAHLKAMALPSMHRRQVILLCEMQDSITPALYLYTMDKKHHPIDMLNIYHQETVSRKTDKGMDKGMTYNEYYITSHYEITVMRYFKGHEDGKQQLEEARRYTISKDGMFEEQPIEM